MSLDEFTPDLGRPSTVEQLARALGIATDVFDFVLDVDDPTKLYRRHLIPKRAGAGLPPVPVQDQSGITILSLSHHDLSQYRVAWEPLSPVVKFAHRSASRILERFLTRPGSGFPHHSSFGYIRGRSTRHNAKAHSGAYRLLSADIKDFFPSISTARVEVALRGAGIHEKVAGKLAKFLSIEGALPLGLNASPLIANLVAHPLDGDLQRMCDSVGCAYTRYADDLTFSGASSLPNRDDLEEVLSRHRFKLNRSKLRWSKRGQKHYVTGLSVSDAADPHAPKRLKRRLRQELYFIEKFGLDNHLSKLRASRARQHEINRIDGTVSYVASIEPRIAAKLRGQWAKVCKDEDIGRSFEPRPTLHLRHATWFVDEAIIERPDGTRMLALCLADVLEPDRLNVDLVTLFAEEAGDAFGTVSSIEIIKKGIHWAEATWNQRERVVSLLATSPIRAMVAMGKLEDASYGDAYIRLLQRLLETALKTADDAAVSITIEENSSKVSKQRITKAVEEVQDQLEDRNQRRPMEPPKVFIGAKGALPAMCVPDVLLGALDHYASSKKSTVALTVTLFERLRNRYSVIFDEYRGVIHHSRNPFRRWANEEAGPR